MPGLPVVGSVDSANKVIAKKRAAIITRRVAPIKDRGEAFTLA